MPTITLTHCVTVQIYGPSPPEDLVFHISVGGVSGGGSVEVTSPQLPAPVSVPTPTLPAQPIPIPQCTDIFLHYYKSETGPNQIEVTYDF